MEEFEYTQDPDQLLAEATVSISGTEAALSGQRKLRSKRSTMLLSVKMSNEQSITPVTAPSLEKHRPVLRISVHELRLKNQIMFIDPPIEEARSNWYEMLDEWLGMCLFVIFTANVYNLNRIQSSRYEIGISEVVKEGYSSVACF